MSYLDFFGLKEDPFKITPDPSFFYESLSHRTAKNLLKYVVENGEGFCVIIGEPGTGKTTILRKFLSELPENYIFALILNPNLAPEEFLKTLLDEFMLPYDKDISKNEILKILKAFLLKNISKGIKTLIIIDEAQLMPVETLEELRLLSNLETEKEKLIQIILVGQPELEEKLKLPELKQLNDRIINKMFLERLSLKEVEKYISHRLRMAGGEKIKIDPKVYELVYNHSKGIPRLINVIMSKALMIAFLDNSLEIKPIHINSAAKSLSDEESDVSFYHYLLIFILFLGIIIALVYILFQTGGIKV
jgi:Type II secretory pathway, component ExeA (predicted ATPase)